MEGSPDTDIFFDPPVYFTFPTDSIELVVAAIPIESLATERADCSATNLLDSTITNDATSWPPYVFINAHERKQYN
jgi:hypothetical protein